ncbi:MAG: GIY-YIG nuclease family protein [Mariprofundales bacterium]
MRSLQRALNKDMSGRRIIDASPGKPAEPLFSGHSNQKDSASGTIYVLRSKSEHPTIKERRAIIHKIGVTGGSVHQRITNAKLDPTFLMADVEVVATYELYNINRSKLENMIHKFFDAVRLDIQIHDRFGHPVVPMEWFLVPLFMINEVVEKIKDGTIGGYSYDPESILLVQHKT